MRLLRGLLLATCLTAALPLAAADAPGSGPEFGTFGIDPGAGDPSIAPGDDFYGHVNGHWLATSTIPPDRAWWGEIPRLRELSMQRVRAILEQAGTAPATPDARKFGDYYASFMDEAGIEAKGWQPIRADLAAVQAMRTPVDLAKMMAKLERQAPSMGFSYTQSDFPVAPAVDVDLKDTSRYQATLAQGGLGLPDRDYYTGTDEATVAARAAFRTYVVTLFTLAGMPDAAARADRVIALETKIAAAHWARADTRDFTKIYNPMTLAALEKAAPGFDWPTYLAGVGLSGEKMLVVAEPSALAGFAKLVPTEPMATWRDYVALRVIGNAAPFLSKPFATADFAYFDTALEGTPERRPRWKDGVFNANLAMGQGIGKVYAERWFPASSKAAMLALIANLKTAMAGRIDRLAWMTPATKVRAKAKLANLRIEVGYPDHFRDYTGLTIVRGDALGNARRAAAYEFAFQLTHLGHPVDRSEWWLTATPQTVNAFNAGPLVKLVFPAGFLAPPSFDPKADPAVNYGAIGAVIGHEISHSFDDQGAKLDEQGRLAQWWTPADEAAFKAATDKLAKQYDGYEPLPGAHINGRLTLGENTADLAGLAAALDAYHASLGGKPAPVLGGLTGDQRFFTSYAQVWRGLQRDPALRQALATDPHSPERYRVYTLRNIDAWYDAFGIKDGKLALPPEQRVRIW